MIRFCIRRGGSRTAPTFKSGLFILIIVSLFLISCTPHFRWRGLQNHLENLRQTRIVEGLPGSYQDFAGAIHVHSTLSHDSEGTIDEIVEAGRKAGSRFVIMTDHHKARIYEQGFEGWYEDFLVIRGSEIIKEDPTEKGEVWSAILVLGLKDYVSVKGLTMPQVVQEVKQRGGLVFAAHPGAFTRWELPLDGMEIYDILDDTLDRRYKFVKYFFDVLYSYDRYRDEVFTSILDHPEEALRKWDELTRTRRIVAIAGNDSHQNIRFAGKQIDPYDLTLRFVRTHILAQELSEESVLAALAAGHAYVSFDILADATGFGFWAEDSEFRGIMGDEVKWTPNLRLKVQSPVVGKIDLIRDGKILKTATARQAAFPVEQPGVYRVEVSLPIRNEWWPWVYSNPIYVRQPHTGS